MSFLRKLREIAERQVERKRLSESPPAPEPAATSDEWEPGQFARASGERIEVRFHDAADAKLAGEQLRVLKTEWQDKQRELAAAKAEEIAKHAAIVTETATRQMKVDLVIRRIDGAIAQVEAYALRKP